MHLSGWGGENATGSSKGYRNGTYCRGLVTASGQIEGQFHTQVFERYSRYERYIAEGLTQMGVSGTSTRYPWGKWLKPCWEWLEVDNTISRLNQSLSHRFDTWR